MPRRKAAPANLAPVVVERREFSEVLSAARVGDESALTYLYRDIQPSLLRYLAAHLPGHEEDLASEVWIDVARGVARFDGEEEAFRHFVFTIARRRVIDEVRRRTRRRTQPADSEVVDRLAAPSPGADGPVLGRLEGEDAVARIRSLLPADQAEVVLLRVVAGLSLSEVAEILGRRPGAVSVLQHRALRKLARRLGPDPGPD